MLKRWIAALLVTALLLPMTLPCAVALADDWDDLSDDDAEAIAMLLILGAMEEEERQNRKKSSSGGSSKSSTKKSSTPSVPSSSAPVTYVTPYNANVRTNGGVLNIRASASKSATILAKLANGSPLVVNGYTGSWYLVSANGVSGFVPSRYVSGSAGTAQQTASVPAASVPAASSAVSAGTYAIVNPSSNFVNMRAQPTKESQVLGVYYYGYRLRVLSDAGTWCQVQDEANGRVGYMMKSLLQIGVSSGEQG